MKFKQDSSKPIYVQISEWIETEIISGAFIEDQKVYSQYQLADMFNINPATAAKGLNILADENLVYKKRGLGMFVSPHAKEVIRTKRININLQKLTKELVAEAARLEVSKEELIIMIKQAKHETQSKEVHKR